MEDKIQNYAISKMNHTIYETKKNLFKRDVYTNKMPRESSKKTKRSKRETPVETSVPEVSDVVAQAAPEPVVETDDTTSESTLSPPDIPTRGKLTREQAEELFDYFLAQTEEFLTQLRTEKKVISAKQVREVLKNGRQVRNRVTRSLKKTRAESSTPTGFRKPVPISKSMAKFTGLSPDELCSRTDVTRYIHDYIKKNNLQNPNDRREIHVDKKLGKLLGTSENFTIFQLQSLLQPHFPK